VDCQTVGVVPAAFSFDLAITEASLQAHRFDIVMPPPAISPSFHHQHHHQQRSASAQNSICMGGFLDAVHSRIQTPVTNLRRL